MKINLRKLRVKIRSLKKPRLALAVIIGIGILVLTSGVAFARYSQQKQSAKKPANQLMTNKNQQNSKSHTNSPNPQNIARNNTTTTNKALNSKIQPNVVNPQCIRSAQNKAFIAEQKRHLDKLNELRDYWLKNGGLSSDGYKNDIGKENDTNRQNMLDMIKSTKQSPEKIKC